VSDLHERYSPEEIAALRDELNRQLEKLERSLRTTRRAARPVQLDQTAVGRLSRIDAIQNQSMTQGLQERQQLKAALLEGALRRMEDGSYGLCEGCGTAIDVQRLHLFPETSTCVACAR
jgi:DnaK suppressor protein